MSKKNVSITSKENDEESLKRGSLSHIDDAIDQTPITKIAKNASLEHPKAIKTEAFATKKHGFDILDEAINKTPITKIVKDGYESKKLEKNETIPYYRYVKTDQDVLESVLKARYNLTDEVAKAFSAKVDTAARIQKLRDELEWPPTKIELYEDRKPLPETGKKETAIEFYNRFWKPYADACLISQDILKNQFGESKLTRAINSQCQREKIPFNDVGPPSQAKLNDILANVDLMDTSKKYLERRRLGDFQRYHKKM